MQNLKTEFKTSVYRETREISETSRPKGWHGMIKVLHSAADRRSSMMV